VVARVDKEKAKDSIFLCIALAPTVERFKSPKTLKFYNFFQIQAFLQHLNALSFSYLSYNYFAVCVSATTTSAKCVKLDLM